jgi:hypothetical protein
MRSIATRVILISIALGATVFGLADTASASHVKLQIEGPAEVAVGHSVGVQATLRSADDGLPVAGAAVTFYTHASFDGVSSKVELGKAVSGKDGVAILNYQPRTSGEHEILVEYLTPGSAEPEVATWSHVAADGGSQMYWSTAGMNVPGLNVWLIIGVVSTVWLILVSVALRVIAIARSDDDAEITAAPSSTGRAGAVSS